MLTQILGWSSQGLFALLVVRALKGRFYTKYPLFYGFITGWFVVGLLRFVFFTFHFDHPGEYGLVYWYTQFLIVAGGYGVLWQIYDHTLNPYPGTAKMAKALVTAILIIVLLEACVAMLSGHADELTGSILRLERNLHSVQAVLIAALVALVWYYEIPLGKNLQGLLLGHGLFITTRLMLLGLQSVWETSFYAWWYYAEQVCVLATVIIWAIALQNYAPNPIPKHAIALERDYELLAQGTMQTLGRARGFLTRGFLQ